MPKLPSVTRALDPEIKKSLPTASHGWELLQPGKYQTYKGLLLNGLGTGGGENIN